jgi:hypothetical protein
VLLDRSEGGLMSIKDGLAARLGENVRESMGAGGAGGVVPPSGEIPGESAKVQGCTRVEAALPILEKENRDPHISF